MANAISADDRRFSEDFLTGALTPAMFNHRAHVRLAYIFLAEHDTEEAAAMMRNALLSFLSHHGIDAAKFHETMTRAWILAVRHFMNRTPSSSSAGDFIDANPLLLDTKIMLTHYSAAMLFSPEARGRFVEPDLQGIPKHE